MQDVDAGCLPWMQKAVGGVHRVGVPEGLQEAVQAGAGMAGLLPAVPYCSWPAEEDLVLPTRCSAEPSEEPGLNKRKGGGGRRNETVGLVSPNALLAAARRRHFVCSLKRE